jgi:glycerol uptake facilitator-like aquaporin
VLTETAARWMLVLHTALGVAAVGAATHLVIWLRRYVKGAYGRRRAVKKFAAWALILHVGAFIAGNIVYPTYRIEVRAAYLENAGAIVPERSARQVQLDKIAAREHSPSVELENANVTVRKAAKAARWFDVKEHWVALGMLASFALVLVLWFYDPSRDGPGLAPIVVGLAVVIAGTVWLGAIIGILTSAWRAV